MPYRNILWIKLEKRLLNDHRFFLMSEKAQLFYIKILLLCAETTNKIPRKYSILKTLLRTECSEKELENALREIKANFPKVLINKEFISVKEFEKRCNRIENRELLGNSQGTPRGALDKNKNKIRKDKDNIYKFSFQGNPCRKDNFTGKWKALDNGEWLEVDERFIKDIKENTP